VGSSLEEILRLDEKAEEETTVLYRQTIRVVSDECDITTRRLFENSLAEE